MKLVLYKEEELIEKDLNSKARLLWPKIHAANDTRESFLASKGQTYCIQEC